MSTITKLNITQIEDGRSNSKSTKTPLSLSSDLIINATNCLSPTTDLHGRTYKDLIPYSSDMNITKTFLQAILNMILKYIEELNDHESPVIKNGLRTPNEYRQIFNFDIDQKGVDLNEILYNTEQILQTSVRSGHPRFINQLSQGLDMLSLAAEIITSTTNSNMFTYEVAPVYNCMEETVLRYMRELCGWKNGDGVLAPGGAVSNLYAVLTARHYAYPDIKQRGVMNSPRTVMIISKHCHYSLKRAAALIGLGIDHVIEVNPDQTGRVRGQDIENQICIAQQQGLKVFFVGITAGTTVLGAFDPIDEIAQICQKYNIWLHVDGAWGGSALLSSKTKHLLNGLNKVDSFTWNPHKLMSVHLQCSAILFNHPNILMNVNEMSAGYLFQPDKHYEITLDTGDKTIQCGRHVDVLKLWLAWKGKGIDGYAEHVETLLENARFLYEKVKSKAPYFLTLMDPPFINVCFWYIPPSLQNIDSTSLEYYNRLDKIAPKIKERMMTSGVMMVGYQRLDHYPNFFRAIVSNPATTKHDIEIMIEQIHMFGKDL
ncbi:unnamed protein product [Didymodactylos carnosus]|uniref:Glutamate decarboxylase n=1 Tax=Didymodactylos carnosus TaxID=1234261 RepID=A0A815SJU5_9BILA|nr:unnamed protein product [Didymodactylos carnosus]CAF1489050.1 unnamed protein product [Didymodactylos carnosus]CAF4066353.1 unnamed protein product [Didymodactylos carnosus]CAF4352392.1 unnamed protein product [Didymodactylos carnosus]